MDPNNKITKKITKKFGSKVIDRQNFHRNTRLKISIWNFFTQFHNGISERIAYLEEAYLEVL